MGYKGKLVYSRFWPSILRGGRPPDFRGTILNTPDLSNAHKARPATYFGLALVTLATMMFEILLTRIFSVTTWYHFAFVAISVAMFGMTAGALIVYLAPNFFRAERAPAQMAWSTLAFGVTMVVCFIAHLHIPFMWETANTRGILNVAGTYAVISIPFVFSGICVCLALTRFPGRVGRLYAADLAGAAAGCIAIIALLNFTDGLSAVIAVAALAGLGGICFALTAPGRGQRGAALAIAAALIAGAGVQMISAAKGSPIVKLVYLKGKKPEPALYERWNSFSRVDVIESEYGNIPFGWGMSTALPPHDWIEQLQLRIDSASATIMTHFDGDTSKLGYLKWDMVNMVHHLRPGSDVAVVGMGGGRDILSALAFDQKSVLAVEINENIIRAVNDAFGDFTGHLDKVSNVTIANDEARSYLTRTGRQFDIVQVSLIDTWAATAAGAFVLSESALYTREAWDIFLGKLRPHGVLTFSHWYFKARPGAMYRLTSLASAALQERGIQDTRGHIMICARIDKKDDPFVHYEEDAPEGLGTILVSPDPFSAKDIANFKAQCKRMNFDLILTPGFALDETFAKLAGGQDLYEFTRNYEINITPPTDDRPFFFNMLWLRDALNRDYWRQGGLSHNMEAVAVLGVLLGTVFLMTGLCIVGPLVLTTRRGTLKGAGAYLLYFGAIGLGFMTIEIALTQRLNLFLGHPVYGLAVVLFGLLVSSSLGSLFAERLAKAEARRGGIGLAVLILVTLIFGAAVLPVTHGFAAASTPLRITLALAMLLPLGFCMGLPFTLGMNAALARKPDLGPWLWGINGAASVCGSVLAVAISLSVSISATFWSGVICYLAALVCYLIYSKR